MDEKGEPKLVIMDIDEYQNLLLGKIKRGVEDVEEINREIVKAQLQEPSEQVEKKPVVKNGFADLREEVIDPSFDFEGPKLDIEDL